jgi:uncharacterized repeat protein (TIGR01451 family)
VLARVVFLLAATLLLTASPASADPEHDAFVTMSDAPDPVQAGDRITYTITVGSNGSGAARDVELEDRIPSGTTLVSAKTSDPDADCDAVRSSTVLRCDLDRIPEGQQVTVVLVVDTSPTTPSPITNVVTIEADDDSVPRNNTARATTTVGPPPGADLVLAQSDSPDPVAAGGRLTYRLTVLNAGPAGARDVALVDDLPASTRRVSASSSQGGCAGSGVVRCALGAIQSGGVVTVTIVVEPTRNGSIVNGASVSAGAPSDPRTSNNTAFTTTRVVSRASPAPPPAAAASAGGAPASPVTVGAAPDVIPPGKVQAVRAMVGSRSVVVRWRVPSDPDFERVELTRSSAGAGRRVVYRGKGERFADRRLRNGVRYAYELRSFDRAGNASAGVRFAARPKALLLFSPLPNARVSAAPLLRWAAVRDSGFYNMQLYRGSKKVLTAWPRSNRIRLRARWTFRGRAERLAPGTYHWFVWPARGPRSRPRYGPLLGRSSFLVVRRAPSRPGGA